MALTGGSLYLLGRSALSRAERLPAAREALFALDSEGTLATCDTIDLEVCYSARNHDEYERIWSAREALYQPLPITPAVTRRARQVQRMLSREAHLRAAGIADLLIAACAEVHGAVVVHYDTDFDVIAARTGQPARWLLPRGTVD